MPCSRGAGPLVAESKVVLVVYLRTVPGRNRSISGVYTRDQAARRLRYMRKQDDFMGHSTSEAA